MSYASDPEWAWKEGYDPARRQAYENQVMIDRAAQEHHRAEFDAAAIIGGAIAAGTWYATREERRAAKAQKRARTAYHRDHYPREYGRRRMEHYRAVEQLEAVYATEISQLQAEINRLDFAKLLAPTVRAERNIEARRAAVRSMLDDKRLTYEGELEALNLKSRDILEYDAAMEAF